MSSSSNSHCLPLSAYHVWLRENAREIRRSHPNLAIRQLAQEAKVLWNGVENRKKYELASKASMDRYDKRVANGEPDILAEGVQRAAFQAWLREINRSLRDVYPDDSPEEFLERANRIWDDVTDRQKYIRVAQTRLTLLSDQRVLAAALLVNGGQRQQI